MVKLKRITTFTKGSGKKFKIKIIRIKLENIIPSIWNWRIKLKNTKTFTKSQGKKLKIQRMRTTLENKMFGKLGLKDEIENK
jgi:hypothetical protein